MFVVLMWTLPDDVSLAITRDGATWLWNTKAAATKWAKRACAWNWQVIEFNP
jgi:hypothetical protein